MSSQNDLIKLNEVIAECTRLLKEQATGWQSIVKEIKNVNQSAPSQYIKMQREASKAVIDLEKAEQQYQRTLAQKQKVEQQILVTERQQVQLSETQRRANEAKERSAQRSAKQAVEQSSAYLRLQRSWRESQRAYADLLATVGASPKAIARARNEFELLDKKIKQVDQATKNYSKNVGNYSSAFSGLGGFTSQVAGALGWAGAIGTAVALGRSIYDTTKQLSILNKSMELGSKDTESYTSNLAFLKRVTEDYGLELLTTSQAYNKFYIASKNKLALEDIQLIFDKVSKSASLMGISVYEQEGIFKALEQMMSKGTVQAEELRGQLGDRLPGAFEIMAKAMNVSTAELGDMMKNGEVMASEVLPKFAIELEKAFGADKVTKVENLTASENRLKNEWTAFIAEINGSDNAIGNFGIAFMNFIRDALSGLNRLSSSWGSLWKRTQGLNFDMGVNQAEQNFNNPKFQSQIKKANDDKEKFLVLQKKELDNLAVLQKKYDDLDTGTIFKKEGFRSVAKEIEKSKANLGQIQGYLKGIDTFLNPKKKETLETVVKDETQSKNKTGDKALKDAERNRKEKLDLDYRYQVATINQMEDGEQKELDLLQAWFEYQKELHKGNAKELLIINLDYWAKLNKINDDSRKKAEEEKKKADKLFLDEQDELFKEDEKNTKEYNDAVQKWKDEADEKYLASQREKDEAFIAQVKKTQEYLMQSTDLGNFGFSSLNIFAQLEENGKTAFENMLENAQDFKEKFAVITNAVGDILKDVLGQMEERQNAYFQQQFANLETEKDLAIKFAGENTAGREAIEKQYEEKKRALQMQQAKQQKQMAILQATINIAQGITSALSQVPPYSFILAGLVGVLGAIQIAKISSAPLPQFWSGTGNAPEGLALTQERGAEMITDKNGKIKTIGNNKGAQLTYLNKGDKVFTADETTQKLNELLIGSGVAPIVNTSVNNGLSKEDLQDVMNKTLANQPKNIISYDELGVRILQEKQNKRTILKNRNVKI